METTTIPTFSDFLKKIKENPLPVIIKDSKENDINLPIFDFLSQYENNYGDYQMIHADDVYSLENLIDIDNAEVKLISSCEIKSSKEDEIIGSVNLIEFSLFNKKYFVIDIPDGPFIIFSKYITGQIPIFIYVNAPVS